MATISNTPRPGYVWDATDNVWYPIGVGGHGHTDYITQATAVNPTIIDAKGDILTATAADTPARLAVGNNGETLVADSAATTGLRYQGSMAGGKNPIINGGFDIWQRGTTTAGATGSSSGYAADRWQGYRGGFASGMTLSRQVTGDTTNLPFVQYCARVQRDSANTGTNVVAISQNLESAMAIPYAGKNIVVSFYARAGANYSSASSVLSFVIYNGTGTDQNGTTGAGYTGSNLVVSQNVTLTTTWQRFNVTATIPSTATEFYTNFAYTPVGTAGVNDYFDVTGVQLEVGSVATQFTRAGGTIQGELAACQRYYYRSTPGTTYGTVGYGLAVSTTVARMATELPVEMRVRPTSVEFSNLRLSDREVVNSAVSALTLATNDTSTKIAATDVTSSSLTAFRFTYLSNNNNTAGYLGFSAEL
jgi:hypothetical protein